MAGNLNATTRLGQAFTADRSAVFASIQRLRVKARDAGKLKSTPQQDVETRTTSSGQQVVVIEPANPQVVYVPQYNAQTVYTQSATSSTVVIQEDNSSNAVAAGLIGFTAGIAIGAAMDNDYYYGPYGWHGGGYMYDDAWDDWYDDREDAREDWQDHREDLVDERGDRASNAQEQRSERAAERPTAAYGGPADAAAKEFGVAVAARREAHGSAGRNRAVASDGHEPGGPRLQPQYRPGGPRSERHEIRRIFGLLEREVRARRQPARTTQPEQLAWRSPVTLNRSTWLFRVFMCATLVGLTACNRTPPSPPQRHFATPDDAVKALVAAAKTGAVDDIVAIFGPDGKELADSSDPATARRNRDVFTVAAAEKWLVADEGNERKVLVVGNEGWPFPVPLVKDTAGWRFDTAAGKEEVLDRRIGRNELAVIRTCRTYVAAQQLYAETGARWPAGGTLRADVRERSRPQNGLFWPSGRGQSAVRWATSWQLPRRRAGRSVTMARSRRPSTATTSRS